LTGTPDFLPKLILHIELDYPDRWHDSEEERQWFHRRILLGDTLSLYTNLMQDEVGKARVLDIREDKQLPLDI
jgi:hypothetical protein